ncbi:MAG: DNA replication/repair protein RecF [Gammaproteobacteria bacterium]|nr:DNA replication/repair protein RecF [Gammaproteobacteria bacterium]
MGRSFRTHLSGRVIQNARQKFSLFAQIDATSIGMERSRDGAFRFKVADSCVDTVAELAQQLPTQLINPDAYRLLDDGPKFRRDFIYWGLFHHEPHFLTLWREISRVLKQRNVALKQRLTKEEVVFWDNTFVELAEKVAKMALNYIEAFKPYFFSLLQQLLLDINGINIRYWRGWAQEQELAALLQQGFASDCQLGYTQYGPQRANLVITVNGIPAKDYLSRGQQKLFVYAMRMAQGMLLQQQNSDKRCLYLVDDLPAELDESKRQALFTILADLDSQIFITSVDATLLEPLLEVDLTEMFHVKHGEVAQLISE